MRIIDRYPIIVTPKFRPVPRFWCQHIGLSVLFEASWFRSAEAARDTLAAQGKVESDGRRTHRFLRKSQPAKLPQTGC